MADKDIHSTGRGGSGNIGKGEGVYADGEIVREGPVGASGRPGTPDYSAGRGGAGNIVHDPKSGSAKAVGGAVGPNSASDVVPEPATRSGHYADYHTGRGGEGNVHRDKYGGHSKPEKGQEEHRGFLEKAKAKLKGDEAF